MNLRIEAHLMGDNQIRQLYLPASLAYDQKGALNVEWTENKFHPHAKLSTKLRVNTIESQRAFFEFRLTLIVLVSP